MSAAALIRSARILTIRSSKEHEMKKTLAVVSLLAIAISILPAALAQAPAEKPKATSAAQSFQEMFDQSLKDKKGITLHVGGQVIGGAVTRVGPDFVELRSQEFARIVVRIDRIDAVAAH
jgi:dissimilatory sulfite reductase (desulfoviridin) alpha/beta subunit